MVNAGPATDVVIDVFAPLLEPGDMMIDCGNAHFKLPAAEAALRQQNLHFVGMGVSGGEQRAERHLDHAWRLGKSYQSLGPMLETISAHVDGIPCCTHIGLTVPATSSKRTARPDRVRRRQLIAEAYAARHAVGSSSPPRPPRYSGDCNTYLVDST